MCDAEGTTVGDAKPGDTVFFHRCVRHPRGGRGVASVSHGLTLRYH